MTVKIKSDETLDDLLHGELKLIQKKDGYRYSADALLLAHFALSPAKGAVVLDMGCGAGTVALILAARAKPARVIGAEIQKTLAEVAERNAELNPTEPKLEVIRADATQLSLEIEPGSIDLIVSNPPFRKAGSGHTSPNPEKALARHELAMSINTWLAEAKKLLTESGKICLVYPLDQEDRLMQAAERAKLFPSRRCRAIDRPGGSGKLLLIEFAQTPCKTETLPDIPIQTDAGKFSLDGYK